MTTVTEKARRYLLALAAAAAFFAIAAPPSQAGLRLTTQCSPTYVWSNWSYGTNTSGGGYVVGALWPPQTFEWTTGGPVASWVYGFAFGAVNRYGWAHLGCLA